MHSVYPEALLNSSNSVSISVLKRVITLLLLLQSWKGRCRGRFLHSGKRFVIVQLRQSMIPTTFEIFFISWWPKHCSLQDFSELNNLIQQAWLDIIWDCLTCEHQRRRQSHVCRSLVSSDYFRYDVDGEI